MVRRRSQGRKKWKVKEKKRGEKKRMKYFADIDVETEMEDDASGPYNTMDERFLGEVKDTADEEWFAG